MQWIVTDRHVSTLIQTDPVLIEASVPKLCLQWFDFYTVVNISDWRRLELAKERNRPILSHMRDERLIREIWARCRPNALHAMRRGAQFYRYPLLPLEPASMDDAPGDPQAQLVTLDWLIFRFDRSKGAEPNSSINVMCEGVVVETT
jgi:hypothetical protein